MALTYRSIPIANSGLWTVQGYEDLGTSAVGPLCFSVHADQIGGQGGNFTRSAKDSADAAAAGYVAEFGGTFSTNTDPFEL